jgi:hypothetical protein
MAAALSHRDEYPWRYYKFERDDLMRMLDGMVAEVAAAKRALFDEHEATCGHSTECWMCCHKERP